MFRESARKFFREVLHPQHKKFEADGKVSIQKISGRTFSDSKVFKDNTILI